MEQKPVEFSLLDREMFKVFNRFAKRKERIFIAKADIPSFLVVTCFRQNVECKKEPTFPYEENINNVLRKFAAEIVDALEDKECHVGFWKPLRYKIIKSYPSGRMTVEIMLDVIVCHATNRFKIEHFLPEK